jgi:molecular chaperone HtpG
MVQNDIQVGKYTLESLTTGMYSDPKIVYREYIQNSVDSLENAVSQNIIEKQSMRIDIIVNSEDSVISIRDNGTGIPSDKAISTLMNIGNSKKRHSNNRGFRGIGRLGGMSYCDTLVFSTSTENEDVKTIVTFDCRKLRELLVPGANEDLDLAAVMDAVTTTEKLEEKIDKHYFMVEMKGVSSFSDLLNIDVARSYISQVAPLPYKSRQFIYSSDLHKQLLDKGYEIEEFPIFVGENEQDLEPIYKPNRHRYHSDRNKMKNDEILHFEYFEVIIEDEIYALGWYGDCNWYGSLSEQEISGMRVRKGNILIGDNKTLNNIFREARFNGWTQGELFIITDKLIPNARRDDFEQNPAYFKLIAALQDGVGFEITKKIRETSLARNDNSAKVLNEVQRQVGDAAIVIEEGFNSSTDKNKLIESLEKADETLKKTNVKPDLQTKKDELQKQISDRIDEVSESNNYKINQINSGIDKKSKKVLAIVSDILSQKLSKPLVDDIIEEIIKLLNRK